MNPLKETILNNLKSVIASVYEMSLNDVNISTTFLEMGLDSISIIQVKQLVKNEYMFDVPVDRLFNDLCNLEKLADFINHQTSALTLPALECDLAKNQIVHKDLADSLQTNVNVTPSQPIPLNKSLPASDVLNLRSIINDQLQVMHKQMELLSKMGA